MSDRVGVMNVVQKKRFLEFRTFNIVCMHTLNICPETFFHFLFTFPLEIQMHENSLFKGFFVCTFMYICRIKSFPLNTSDDTKLVSLQHTHVELYGSLWQTDSNNKSNIPYNTCVIYRRAFALYCVTHLAGQNWWIIELTNFKLVLI